MIKTNKDNFILDSLGRTSLFYAVEANDMKLVRSIIFSESGVGMSCSRLLLLQIQDKSGLKAYDLAIQHDFQEIANLLEYEESRMLWFE
ncbi:hypothetical protein AD998_00445 [bacterium 336/3]|nr:hypothetical protein AD998_00445 [bacterium 336/3]